MKKTILTFAITAFIAGITLVGCNNPPSDNKVENAKEDVNEAKQDLREAENDYAREWQEYRNEQLAKLANNDKEIADYRVKIKTEKAEVRERKEKRLAELERENNELKVRLDNYKDDGQNNWQQFKTEFNQSMDHLGQGFKNLFADNDPND